MSDNTKRKLKTFPGLEAEQFMHPWDTKATEGLASVPGLDTVVRKVMEYGFERVFYLENIADNVRVTDKMFPKLYRYLRWACQILDVEEPEMYVSMAYDFNAFTYGHTRPFIVLNSGLLDILDEQERFYVIAHELGHIKCDHVLYTVVAENLKSILDVVGRATLGLGSLVGSGLALPLYDWYRKAELSADRAALLCVQNPEVATRVFMKMAGGSLSLFDDMDREAFLDQIRAYEERDDSKLDKAYKFLITAFRTHPFPIMRAKHLDEWVTGGGFAQLAGIETQLDDPAESS
jgi:Zn-dependent protease with chaperone function